MGDKLILISALTLVTIQGTLIFRNAMKSKIPNPWLWGLIGLLNIPTSTIIYLIYKRLYFKKKNKK